MSTTYSGESGSESGLKENQAIPLALAAADFDEDGVPDLVSSYAHSNRGILTLHRGNVDSVYPNSREAQQRKANGEFIDSPFLPSVRAFELPLATEFIGAGDFDADGHSDLVAAGRGRSELFLSLGDGRGNFGPATTVDLPGSVTALVTGETNRADGLIDLVVGILGADGPRVLIFEGPAGALNAKPEVLNLPAEATTLALGQLDDGYALDLAVGAGSELLIVRGRDRRLSLDETRQADVPQAVIDRRSFSFAINSIAYGDFTSDHQAKLALLSSDGTAYLVSGRQTQDLSRKATKKGKEGEGELIPMGQWPGATRLARARVSNGLSDDLIVLEAAGRQLHILTVDGPYSDTRRDLTVKAALKSGRLAPSSPMCLAASLDVEDEPVVVLPMRLNPDALTDLVVLHKDHSWPAVVMTAAGITFTVNTADDHDDGICDGKDCTLRESINAADSNPGVDTIAFNIPGAGVHTITPTSALPTITDPVTIDGTTQPGFAGTPIIELDGSSAGVGVSGLVISAGNSTVRGLVVNRFSEIGIFLHTNGGDVIQGNFVGTNIDGTGKLGNGTGISAFSSNNLIGGTTSAARNLISGNSNFVGINMQGGGSGNVVHGNFIGTDVSGTASLANGDGIFMANSSNNVVGGTITGTRNIISGNINRGIEIAGPGGNLIQGNFIGTNAAGTAALGNINEALLIYSPNNSVGGTTPSSRNIISANGNGVTILELGNRTSNIQVQGNFIGTDASGGLPLGGGFDGVFIDASVSNCSIGGANANAGNIIAFSRGNGVQLFSGTGTSNTILSNSIFSNGGLGIDLGGNGITANDPCDGDTGVNNLQNFPVITSAFTSSGSTTIQGTLNSTTGSFTIQFFSNAGCDPSGFGEGQTFIGSTTAMTGADCNANFSVTLPVVVAAGRLITATATDQAGNTSEFSQCVQVQVQLDICVQDDSNGNLLQFNSTTGEYQFTTCGSGLVLSGTGSLIQRGSIITLQHYATDRRVLARIDGSVNKATASIQVFSLGTTFTIMDRNTTNNTCSCP